MSSLLVFNSLQTEDTEGIDAYGQGAHQSLARARCFKEICEVGKVDKVVMVGKEVRLREQRLPTLYQILQQSNKNGVKNK